MAKRNPKKSLPTTSWDGVHRWYHDLVGKEGHYYHRRLIVPKTLAHLNLQRGSSLLDVACGQGVLARAVPEEVAYLGIDLSPSLIKLAKNSCRGPNKRFQVGDAAAFKAEGTFSHAALILAAQNFSRPGEVFEKIALHLAPGGKLVVVLNHPCFRIPRQTSWQVDEAKKIQYRRVDRYMSSMEIPIRMHPGNKERAEETLSFHHPLSKWIGWLHKAGFVLTELEELCSDKTSSGGAAKMENRARSEIPLFMLLSCQIPG